MLAEAADACRSSPTSSTDQQVDAPQLAITINRDQAARFGIPPQLIDDTLNDAFGQRQVTQYFTQTQLLSRRPRSRCPSMQGDLQSLDSIYVQVAADRAAGAAVDAGHHRQPKHRPALGHRTRASSRR